MRKGDDRPDAGPGEDASAVAGRLAPLGEDQSSADTQLADPDRDLTATVDATTEAAHCSASAALLTPEVVGRYELRAGRGGAELGRGGLGRVLAALDRHLGREIAVKELLSPPRDPNRPARDTPGTGGSLTPEAARFLREARITAQLTHPNIVPVYELGQRQDGTVYYTMKRVRGTTLRGALAGCSSLEERLELLSHYTDLCHAIAYAHSQGVVHRDIKTDNVMVGEFGETVVLDWGLAKAKGQRDVHGGEIAHELEQMRGATVRTVAGSTMGTPAYMSPEQARGDIDAIDERSDVWSLGVVLYELLTGMLPFRGAHAYDTIAQVLDASIVPPDEVDSDIPPELALATMKALSRDKARRHANAGELARDIERYGSDPRLRRQFLEAELNLAQAFDEKAENLLLARRFLEARISAAASLLHNPANPNGPRFTPGFARRHPSAHELRTRALSTLYQSQHDGLLTLARDLDCAVVPSVEGRSFMRWASPERWATVTREGSIAVGDASGRALRIFAVESLLLCVALARSAGWLAGGGADGVVHIWDVVSGAELTQLSGPEQAVSALAASSDDSLLAVGFENGWVQLWDTRSWTILRQWQAHGSRLTSLAFSFDSNRLASGHLSGMVGIWEVASAQNVAEWKAHASWVVNVAFSPNEQVLVSASLDRVLCVWEATDGPVLIVSRALEGPLFGLEYAPDGDLALTVALDGQLHLWDTRDWTIIEAHRAHHGLCNACFSPTGEQILSAGLDGRVRLWDLQTAPIDRRASGSDGHVLALAYSPDGRELAFAGFGEGIFRWRPPSRRIHQRLAGHGARTFGLSFSPDGGVLASGGGDRRLILWNLDADTRTVVECDNPEADLVFTDAGTRISFTERDGRRVHEVEVATGKPRRELDGHRFVAISPDERYLATSSRRHPTSLRVLDRATGQLLHELKANSEGVWCAAFSPDGRWLATGGEIGSLLLWDTRSYGEPKQLIGHDAMINRAHFSPDNTLLVTGSDDCTARIWDLSSGQTRLLIRSKSAVVPVRFAPDGRSFALGDGNFAKIYPVELKIWDVAAGQLREAAESASGMTLDGFALKHSVPREPGT